MNVARILRLTLGGLSGALIFQPHWVRACAACYGQSDAPMAHGMNWGIMSLLAIIMLVLAGVASFFVYLARRAVAMQTGAVTGELAGATERA